MPTAGGGFHRPDEANHAWEAVAEFEHQRYQDLFQSALEPYLVTDLHGRILEANRPAAELLNHAPPALAGRLLVVFLAAADLPDFRRFLTQVRFAPRAQRAVFKVRPRGSKSSREVEVHVAAVRPLGGQATVLRWRLLDLSQPPVASRPPDSEREPQVSGRDSVALAADSQPASSLAALDTLQATVLKLEQEIDHRRRTEQALQHSREEERARIARELHDELGSTLTALKMEVAEVRQIMAANDLAGERLAVVDELIELMADSVRELARELRPPVLDRLGLFAALEWHFREFQAHTGLPGRLQINCAPRPITTEAAVALFRIFQEALTNVARHAHAGRVEARVEADESFLYLEVRDDGGGFTIDLVNAWESVGLLGMRERAEVLGGELIIDSQPGQGTRVCVKCPLASLRPREASS